MPPLDLYVPKVYLQNNIQVSPKFPPTVISSGTVPLTVVNFNLNSSFPIDNHIRDETRFERTLEEIGYSYSPPEVNGE